MELLQVSSDQTSNTSVEGHLYCVVTSITPELFPYLCHLRITPSSVEGFAET